MNRACQFTPIPGLVKVQVDNHFTYDTMTIGSPIAPARDTLFIST